MEGSRSNTQRLAPEERREQLLEACRRAVLDKGFSGLTMDAVAREAGISRPVVYDQFGDLEGLMEAFIADAEERALRAVGGALPSTDLDESPDELLGGAMRSFLEAVRADPETWRIILVPPEGTPPAVRARIEQRRGELAGDVAAILDGVVARRGILAGIDTRLFARILISMAEEMGRLVLDRPKTFNPSRIARSMSQIARLLPDRGGPGR